MKIVTVLWKLFSRVTFENFTLKYIDILKYNDEDDLKILEENFRDASNIPTNIRRKIEKRRW